MITPGLQQAVQKYEGRTLSADLRSSGGDARLIWQSTPGLIEPGSISYADSRITFSLTGRPTSLGGNAVIGLIPMRQRPRRCGAGTSGFPTKMPRVWSRWPRRLRTMYSTYETAYGAGSAVMMDRNLGAIYKEDGPYARSFRASLFQWGRKDPFPWGTVVFDQESVPHNYIDCYGRCKRQSPGQYAGYTGNTYYATAHPEVFIATTSGTSYDWYYGRRPRQRSCLPQQ
ncbi:MAG: hypothetical protein V8Q28_04020 [Alistipes sp.]